MDNIIRSDILICALLTGHKTFLAVHILWTSKVIKALLQVEILFLVKHCWCSEFVILMKRETGPLSNNLPFPKHKSSPVSMIFVWFIHLAHPYTFSVQWCYGLTKLLFFLSFSFVDYGQVHCETCRNSSSTCKSKCEDKIEEKWTS